MVSASLTWAGVIWTQAAAAAKSEAMKVGVRASSRHHNKRSGLRGPLGSAVRRDAANSTDASQAFDFALALRAAAQRLRCAAAIRSRASALTATALGRHANRAPALTSLVSQPVEDRDRFVELRFVRPEIRQNFCNIHSSFSIWHGGVRTQVPMLETGDLGMPILEGMKIVIDTAAQTLTQTNGAAENTVGLFTKEAFEALSLAWVRVGWSLQYYHNFTWFGLPVLQLPEDLLRLQEVIYALRPAVIVETGVYQGGSLLFHASLLRTPWAKAK